MREKIWLTVRQWPRVPRLRAVPLLGQLITGVSHLLLPSYSQYLVRVQGGHGKGLLLTLNPRWETALWQGSYESSVQSALVSLMGPGKFLYDVGGGIGFYTLLAARLGARALVFEPDACNARCIRCNAEINGLASRIRIVEGAAFSHTGFLAIKPAGQRRGHGSAHAMNDLTAASLATVPCTRLDDCVVGHQVPDVVKIDVEGAESEVLTGAEGLFTNFRPHIICEVHDAANARFIEQWLSRMGYNLQWLERPTSFPYQLMGRPN